MKPYEEKRHAAGLCIQCGQPKTTVYLRCDPCRAKVNRTSKRFYAEVTRPANLAEKKARQLQAPSQND